MTDRLIADRERQPPDFWYIIFPLVLSCSGEVYVHHAGRHSDEQAEGEEERTGPILLPGRAQVLHPVATLQEARQGQKWASLNW